MGMENCVLKDIIKKNKLYRIDGPSIIVYYDDGNVKEEVYCIDDKLHRKDGPAVIEYNREGIITREEYWLEDMVYNDVFQWSVKVGSY